jgi:hypothetical protein
MQQLGRPSVSVDLQGSHRLHEPLSFLQDMDGKFEWPSYLGGGEGGKGKLQEEIIPMLP